MEIEFKSTAEYRRKYAHFYDAILTLLKNPKTRINVNSVTKQAGFSRSSIRKDRDQWKPLFEDIEIANNFQLKKPHFVAKATVEKSKAINANAKEYKAKYLNLLSAFYDLSRIVDEQHKMIKQLKLEITEKSDNLIKLKQKLDRQSRSATVVPISNKK